ncbi:MAG: hypothetical protein ABSF91_16305 [Bacteroidota bacterium]
MNGNAPYEQSILKNALSALKSTNRVEFIRFRSSSPVQTSDGIYGDASAAGEPFFVLFA